MRTFAICVLTAVCLWASAQDYPVKPVRLIVATAPGGLMDVAAHTLVDYFQKAYA